MRAMRIERFGGPDVLEPCEMPRPSPGAGELLVRVRAAGTNPVEAKIRQGVANPDLELPAILGGDVSGVVAATGVGVHDVEPGDEVFYTPELGDGGGGYAEYNVVAAALVAPKPASLSHVEAAAIPLAGGTAWEGIVRRLAVRPGQTVLVNGGSGGVGSFAVQFARAAGAVVLATAGPDNQDTLRDLGAVPIDYRRDDVVEVTRGHTDGAGADAVFDVVGGEQVARCLRAARSFASVATVLAPDGTLSDLYQRNQVLHGIYLTRERRRLEEMAPLFQRGTVHPLIEQTLPLDQVARAHRRMDTGHGRGKIVLEVD